MKFKNFKLKKPLNFKFLLDSKPDYSTIRFLLNCV